MKTIVGIFKERKEEKRKSTTDEIHVNVGTIYPMNISYQTGKIHFFHYDTVSACFRAESWYKLSLWKFC